LEEKRAGTEPSGLSNKQGGNRKGVEEWRRIKEGKKVGLQLQTLDSTSRMGPKG
jgi:hypothetical protein